MEAFIWTLLAAALTGLTWLAYKEPAGYHRLYMALFPWICASAIGYGLWAASNALSLSAVLEFVPPEKVEAAKAAASVYLLPTGRILLAYFLVITYMLALGQLRAVLGPSNEKSDDHR